MTTFQFFATAFSVAAAVIRCGISQGEVGFRCAIAKLLSSCNKKEGTALIFS